MPDRIFHEDGDIRDVLLVCRGGHRINDRMHSLPQRTTNFCEQCGEETVSECDACGWRMKGDYQKPVMYGPPSLPVPEACGKCGKAFPWKGKRDQRRASGPPKPTAIVVEMLERFHVVARQLARRQRDRAPFPMADEYDIQDLMHALLRLRFDDVRAEEWTPSYAGKACRMDFLLKAEKIVIEAKYASERLREKDLGEQLLVDIAKYEEHGDCETLICFIYDAGGVINNPRGLVRDLEAKSSDKIRVIVVINPMH